MLSCLSRLDFYCADAGGRSVVFTSPTIICGSAVYSSHLVVVLAVLVAFVIGFPLVAAGLLSRHRRSIHSIDDAKQAHARLWAGVDMADAIPPALLLDAASR